MAGFSLLAFVALFNCVFRAVAAPPPPHDLLENGVDRSGLPDIEGRSVLYPIPFTGEQELLIVPVDFPDRQGLFTGEDWREAFFGERQFVDYFLEVSYDQLRYNGSVVGIHDGAPVENSNERANVRLPEPITFYADKNRGFNVGNFPRNSMGVVAHAVQALDDAGFDFAPFADNDNIVQNLVVVFSGIATIYTGDFSNGLEATAYRISLSNDAPFRTKDGYIIDNFTFCPEQRYSSSGDLESGEIAHVGICVHEHGHALGMPDLYDYTYETTGVGEFDVMGYGTYGGYETGEEPFHFGAFSKTFFGWAIPEVYGEGSHDVTLRPAVMHSDIIKLYPKGDESATEYYLLENRQLLGFDRHWDKIPGLCAGLVIWHIDDEQVQRRSRFVKINTSDGSWDYPHPGVSVVEADGGDDIYSSPPNFGGCEDVWKVGDTWAEDVLWDGTCTGLTVWVKSTESNNLGLEIIVESKCRTSAPTSTPTSSPLVPTSPTSSPPPPPCDFFCRVFEFFMGIFNFLFGWLF